MKTLDLIRVAEGEHGTFGVLLEDSIPFALTLEPEWIFNEEDVSCIPAHDYLCKRHISPKFGETFLITNVPNRTDILFHRGNLEYNTKGCILVGEQFEPLWGKPGVASSRKGFSEFMRILKGHDTLWLRIMWGRK
ncbi:hypothetical protein IIA15_00405 [candidate division TA06 bacterium]|nr:hypothetical protein [candidate division TA06 bacterium]